MIQVIEFVGAVLATSGHATQYETYAALSDFSCGL